MPWAAVGLWLAIVEWSASVIVVILRLASQTRTMIESFTYVTGRPPQAHRLKVIVG